MINSVEIGKKYALYLLQLYGGTKNNVLIIGKTTIDNVVRNQDDYNIYQTYFEPIGLGLTSYYTAIQENTDIYICNPIDSLEPLEVSDDKLFIPATLIDMNKSSEYVEAFNLNFHIYPIVKRFKSVDERDAYLTEIKNKIKGKLKELIDFSALDSEIDTSYDTVYLTKEDIEFIEDKVNTQKEYRDRIIREYRSRETEKEFQYNKALADMNRARDDYLVKQRAAEDLKIVLEREIKTYRDLIAEHT